MLTPYIDNPADYQNQDDPNEPEYLVAVPGTGTYEPFDYLSAARKFASQFGGQVLNARTWEPVAPEQQVAA
jgi:hypothetical protein